jgi:hypothetical protein
VSAMKRKIFFIHVAKTAGSSFNTFLERNFVGASHCEGFLNENATSFLNLEHLKALDYISGHLHFSLFERNFPREEYFALTFMREPVAQLISHINWVIHIYDIGLDFFQAHPKEIQDMCLELRHANLYDPDIFISCLKKFDWLFKNNQSKYFVENQENLRSVDALENISKLDMIGITEFYERSLQEFITLNQLEVDIKVDFANQNTEYKIKKDICDNALINEFIQDYNGVDIDVYEHVLHQCQPSNADTDTKMEIHNALDNLTLGLNRKSA